MGRTARILIFVIMLTGLLAGEWTENVVYAANERKMTSELDKVSAAPKDSTISHNAAGATTTAVAGSNDITPETYNSLIEELLHIGERSKQVDHTVRIDGEIRYHYAFNHGPLSWGRDSSGFRMYLSADTAITTDWRVYGMLEGDKSIVNYYNELKDSRLYLKGRVGTSVLYIGSFGYLMANGNIYDSGFDGVRMELGGPVKYTLSYGNSHYTKDTYIATARYADFDYNLEAGVYHYKQDDTHMKNTITTVSGNYNFNNWSIGAMLLQSSLKDRLGNGNGIVFSIGVGELKTYRKGSYDIFAKYYNQSEYTYISHGMNGLGNSMQGFKGFGAGFDYAIAENWVAGIQYFSLTDKVSGRKGNTWWNEITYYF